jgi:hypothetical protein
MTSEGSAALPVVNEPVQQQQQQQQQSNKFVYVPNLLSAGLGHTNDPSLFYRRMAFDTLEDFVGEIVDGNHIGLVDGLPGTGKSSTIWWALQQEKFADQLVAWLHMDQSGECTAFVTKPIRGGDYVHNPNFLVSDIENIDANVVVIDGANQANFGALGNSLRRWYFTGTRKGSKSGFITMSNKIKWLHLHEQKQQIAAQKAGMGVRHPIWPGDEV